MREPANSDLGGSAPLRVAKRLFLVTRPMFLFASVLPVLLGTALGWRASGIFDGVVLLLGLAAIACTHSAGNVIKDVFDDSQGTARPTKPQSRCKNANGWVSTSPTPRRHGGFTAVPMPWSI